MKTRTLREVCYIGQWDRPKEWVVIAEAKMKVNAENWDEWRAACERVYSAGREAHEQGKDIGFEMLIGGKRFHCTWSEHIRCCDHCGVPYVAPDKVSKYCPSCGPTAAQRRQTAKRKAERQAALAARPCDHCGETFTPRRKDAKFCSTKCRVYHARAK